MSSETGVGIEEEQPVFQLDENVFDIPPIKELINEELLKLQEERDKEIAKLLESQQEESKQLEEKNEEERINGIASECEEQLKNQLGASQLEVISGWKKSTIIESPNGATYFQDEEGKRSAFKDDTGTKFAVQKVSIEEDFRGKEYGGSIKIHLRSYEDAHGNMVHEFKEQTYRPPKEQQEYEVIDTDYPTLSGDEPAEVNPLPDPELLSDTMQSPQEEKVSIFGFAQTEIQVPAKESVSLLTVESVQKNTIFDKEFAPGKEIQKKLVEKDEASPTPENKKQDSGVREKEETPKQKVEKREITQRPKEATLLVTIPEAQFHVENNIISEPQEPAIIKTIDASTITTIERAFPEIGRVEVVPSLPNSPWPQQELNWGNQSLNELLDVKLVEIIETTIQEYNEQGSGDRVLLVETPTPQEPVGGAIIIEPTEHGSFEVLLHLRPEPIISVDIFSAPDNNPRTPNLSTTEYIQAPPSLPDYSPATPLNEKTEIVPPATEINEKTVPIKVISETTSQETESLVSETEVNEEVFQEKDKEEIGDEKPRFKSETNTAVETQPINESIVLSPEASAETTARERGADKSIASQEINTPVESAAERQPLIIPLVPFPGSRQPATILDDSNSTDRSRQTVQAARAINQAA